MVVSILVAIVFGVVALSIVIKTRSRQTTSATTPTPSETVSEMTRNNLIPGKDRIELKTITKGKDEKTGIEYDIPTGVYELTCILYNQKSAEQTVRMLYLRLSATQVCIVSCPAAYTVHYWKRGE